MLRPRNSLGKLWVYQLIPNFREHCGSSRGLAVHSLILLASKQHSENASTPFLGVLVPQFLMEAIGSLNMVSFFPLVSGEITSKGALSGFSKGHESENLEVGGPVSITATARGGAAGQGTRTERRNQIQRSVWRGPLSPSGHCSS